MEKADYIETLNINGKKVDVGLDDYGQCYYFEYTDDSGEVRQIGCGSYNSNYLEEIYGYFDPKGTFISIEGEDVWNENTEFLLNLWKEKGWAEDHPEEYKELVTRRNRTDYNIYDFNKMYKERELNVYNVK